MRLAILVAGICWPLLLDKSAQAPRPDESAGVQVAGNTDASTEFNAIMQSLDSPSASTSAPAATPVNLAASGVIGSKHDFSARTGRVSDACGACHVPHLQAVKPTQRDGNQSLLELFRIGNQRDVPQPSRGAPGASSLICLSCHNGTVASSTIGTAHAMVAAHRDGFVLGDFAVRDHPIGISYPSTAKGYHPVARVRNLGLRLPDDRVECISCHDPHNARGIPKMLAMSNQRSALCLACHDK